jgi:hypothetical protein
MDGLRTLNTPTYLMVFLIVPIIILAIYSSTLSFNAMLFWIMMLLTFFRVVHRRW